MSVQPKKSLDDIKRIINEIEFMDRSFRVDTMGSGYFLQVQYMEANIDTGEVELQKARKWYISPFSTDTEVVETAFKACRTSMDHVLKEHFLYHGHRVYSPHFNIDARLEMCDRKFFDERIPIPND